MSPPNGSSPAEGLGVADIKARSRAGSPLGAVSIIETPASPPAAQSSISGHMFSSALMARSASAQTASTDASSATGQSYKTPAMDAHAFVPPPPVDLDSEYSEATDDDENHPSSRRKGWRKAFSRGKKGSEGSTRSSSPGRTVSTSQVSTGATATSGLTTATPTAPTASAHGPPNSGRRLSIGQGVSASRRKSVESSRPNTPLRESHVAPPAFGAQEPLRVAKSSKESQRSPDKSPPVPATSVPIPIRASKTLPTAAAAAASDRAISDLLASSPSESRATGNVQIGGSGSRKLSASILGKSPGSHGAVSPPATSLYGSSPGNVESGGRLMAVKNPRPQGQEKEGGGALSKREAKKIADDSAKKDIDAIKDAVRPPAIAPGQR